MECQSSRPVHQEYGNNEFMGQVVYSVASVEHAGNSAIGQLVPKERSMAAEDAKYNVFGIKWLILVMLILIYINICLPTLKSSQLICVIGDDAVFEWNTSVVLPIITPSSIVSSNESSSKM
jgi:hypothetical protein